MSNTARVNATTGWGLHWPYAPAGEDYEAHPSRGSAESALRANPDAVLVQCDVTVTQSPWRRVEENPR